MGGPAAPLSVEIEPFRREDQAAVQRLILDGLHEHWGRLDPGLNPDLEDIEASYAPGTVLVARHAGRIVGVGAIVPTENNGGELTRMSVARGMRRQGIGAALVRALAAEAARRGWRNLELETTAHWEDAVQFYGALGFELTRYEEGAFGRDAFFRMDLHPDSSWGQA